MPKPALLLVVFLACALLAPALVRAADPAPAAAAVTITQQNGLWRITAPCMEALVGPDGCMTSLRFPFPDESWVHVPNYLKPGVGLPPERGAGGSRGAFFYQDERLSLPDVHPDGDHALVASSDRAAIRYDFSPTGQVWTLTNKTTQPMQLLMVLDPTVNAVRGPSGAYRPTPVIELWSDATFFQGKRRLQITGGSRLWGPGPLIGQDWRQGQFQVWEATLAPQETRTVTLTPGVATTEESTTLAGVAPEIGFRGTEPQLWLKPAPAVAGDLTVYSPREYQVFQRQSKTQGQMLVAGAVLVPCDKVEVRLTGTGLQGKLPDKWQPLPLEKLRRTFRAELTVPAGGWYQVEFRALQGGKSVATATLAHVGVGEIFIGCGQSNSTNCGAERQTVKSGMVSTFGGNDWRIADDPQPGTHDTSDMGSFWPAFGDAMYARYKVPIGVAVTGQGGAPVISWRPGENPFLWTMTRLLQLGPGGFRGVLYHQGESDVRGTQEALLPVPVGPPSATPRRSPAGPSPGSSPRSPTATPRTTLFPAVRAAQKQLWDEGLALPGPDTDTLTGDYRAGIHFAAKGLQRHGELWAEKVSEYLDKVLAD